MVPQKYPNINSLWGTLMIEELIRNGVDYFCISPGSRSTPLTAAVALHKKAKSLVHFDERGTAFHALGYVSATRKPAALICTSGTAVANFFPAIIEASKKKLPVIVLTADRPPELQKSGTDQTIDQSGIFGKYAKWQLDVPCPTDEIKPEFILTTIDQAVHQAKTMVPGPVHLNCLFREPLAPVGKDQNYSTYLKNLSSWIADSRPYTVYVTTQTTESYDPVILESVGEINNGIIAVGKLNTHEEQKAVLQLSQKLNWPIFPDMTSGLRLGVDPKSHVIAYYDQVLLSEKFIRNLKIDGVLHLGGRMCSKRYYQFIERVKPKRYIAVLPHPLRNDPLHTVAIRVQSPIADFCQYVTHNIPQRKPTAQLSQFKQLNDSIDNTIDQFISKSKSLSEIAVARLISQYIPKNAALFLASSMPIRDMDMFAASNGNSVIIGSNRGASGIDGTIASAIGFAKGHNRPTTLIIGDLAFLHDLNSLAMARELKTPFVIILVNNNGGGIFNFLPIARRKDIFEKYFAAPHNFDFELITKYFGVQYKLLRFSKNFVQSYQRTTKDRGVTILEIKISRIDNTATHKKLQNILKGGRGQS